MSRPQRSPDARRDAGTRAPRAPLPFKDAKQLVIEPFERAYLTRLFSEHPTLASASRASGLSIGHLRVLSQRYDVPLP